MGVAEGKYRVRVARPKIDEKINLLGITLFSRTHQQRLLAMTPCTTPDRTGFHAAARDRRMAVATEGVKIRFDRQCQFGSNLVTEIAGVTAGVVKKIVMAGRALHCAVVVMVKRDLQQWSRDHQMLPPVIKADGQSDENAAYKQGSRAHNAFSTSGG
jgi:hypothetical protein